MDCPIETEVLGSQLPGGLNYPSKYVQTIEPLDCRHLRVVFQVAAESFPTVWSEKEFAYFLAHENRVCRGVFTTVDGQSRLRSYFLGLLVQGDLDIVSIATRADDRRLGLGECLLRDVLALPEIRRAFLEVEVENLPASRMYEKIGFQVLGRRHAYYGPNRDAYLMRWLK